MTPGSIQLQQCKIAIALDPEFFCEFFLAETNEFDIRDILVNMREHFGDISSVVNLVAMIAFHHVILICCCYFLFHRRGFILLIIQTLSLIVIEKSMPSAFSMKNNMQILRFPAVNGEWSGVLGKLIPEEAVLSDGR